MSIRINLDLAPEYEAFVKEWADKLGISLSELMRRLVHEACNGYRYDEEILDYYPPPAGLAQIWPHLKE